MRRSPRSTRRSRFHPTWARPTSSAVAPWRPWPSRISRWTILIGPLRCDLQLAHAYLHRGRLRTEKGEFDAALADFDQVMSMRPNDAECYLNRGICLAKKGIVSDATDDFRRVLKLTNHSDYADPARFYLNQLSGDQAGVRALAIAPAQPQWKRERSGPQRQSQPASEPGLRALTRACSKQDHRWQQSACRRSYRPPCASRGHAAGAASRVEIFVRGTDARSRCSRALSARSTRRLVAESSGNLHDL